MLIWLVFLCFIRFLRISDISSVSNLNSWIRCGSLSNILIYSGCICCTCGSCWLIRLRYWIFECDLYCENAFSSLDNLLNLKLFDSNISDVRCNNIQNLALDWRFKRLCTHNCVSWIFVRVFKEHVTHAANSSRSYYAIALTLWLLTFNHQVQILRIRNLLVFL